ncbi:hypothetical protein BUALT_Bualt04G0016600 [Buddleja alternifolia]|uniref:Uncharacterized protein n=1 Tax=Buddleja alternifolia TaxID=168488 RepID=A0AAV6XW60_9LAMI|nr:hypothetical protein BUALT_Bualt04G0016600 [Buddleja alternifolia]
MMPRNVCSGSASVLKDNVAFLAIYEEEDNSVFGVAYMSVKVLELLLPVLAIFVVSILASASCQGSIIRARSGVVAADDPYVLNGLGGGGFMLVRQATGEAKVFDMKEMAPQKASQRVASQSGSTIFQKNLANTLLEISKMGMMAFYNGSIGRNLTKDVLGAGGILTMEDLQSYRVKIRKPIAANVMGFEIITAPPPASGGAMLILILKILDQYGISRGSDKLKLHRTIEALKYALAMRMELGDPDFVDIKNTLVEELNKC